MSNLAIQITTAPDMPFTDITGEDIGGANTRFEMMWGTFKLKRIKYTPYGNTDKYPSVWSLDNTNISDLTMDNGNKIADFLEQKWNAETADKTIVVTKAKYSW